MVTSSKPWHPPVVGDEKTYTFMPIFWRGLVLLHFLLILLQMRVSTQGDQRGSNRQASEMVSTKCSTRPSIRAAPLAHAQQCVNAGLTHPGCAWPQASETLGTLYLSHKELPHDCPAALPAPLLCSHSLGVFRTACHALCITLAKLETETAVELSLQEDIHNTPLALIFPLR